MPRGGKREGSGRRRGQSAELPDQVIDNGFATRVLDRIGEGKPKEVKSAEDYALNLLFDHDIQTQSYNFNRLLDRRYGKPVQPVFKGDSRETTTPLTRGNLPSHFPAQQSSGTHKPN